jgi:hypothetical protein
MRDRCLPQYLRIIFVQSHIGTEYGSAWTSQRVWLSSTLLTTKFDVLTRPAAGVGLDIPKIPQIYILRVWNTDFAE